MRYTHLLLLVAVLSTPAVPSEAQQTAKPVSPAPQQSSPGFALSDGQDARETRSQLEDVFRHYPPSVREVLRIDPSLISRADYIATYPKLAAFLQQHPEIAHNPSYFLGDYQAVERANTPNMAAVRALGDFVSALGVALVVMTITAGVILLVKTAVEHRRWQRALRAHTDLHTKLIDRFSSSDELLSYLQSPAGKLLTETPAMPQAAPRAVSAPLNRIFWSVQAGIVTGALGAGLIYVSRNATIPEVYQLLSGIGIVILTIGLGFTVSAAVSYFLSQRLGLVQVPSRYGGETSSS